MLPTLADENLTFFFFFVDERKGASAPNPRDVGLALAQICMSARIGQLGLVFGWLPWTREATRRCVGFAALVGKLVVVARQAVPGGATYVPGACTVLHPIPSGVGD